MALSNAQHAEILAIIWKDGALSLSEIQTRVQAELRAEVWSALEFARRHGHITPAPGVLPDGSREAEPAWMLTVDGREFVVAARSPFPRLTRRLAADVGTQLARTWIPIVLLVTVGLMFKGKFSGWKWVLLIEFAVFVPGAWLITTIVNRRVRRSVLGDT